MRELIDAVGETVAKARCDGCTLETLSSDLASLAEDLEVAVKPALAFVVNTASQSCKNDDADLASVRFAVVDLCERLVASLETDSLFDFTDIDPALNDLLFPPAPTFDGGPSVDEARVPDSERTPEDTENHPIVGCETGDGYETVVCSDLELLREFLDDAKEHLEQAELLLLDLESDPKNPDAINGLFRAIHSVKGSSGVIDLPSLADVSHYSESVLDRVRDGELGLTDGVFDIVLLSVDFLKRQVESVERCCKSKEPLRSPSPPTKLILCLEAAYRNGVVDVLDLDEVRHSLFVHASGDSSKSESSAASEAIRVDGRRLEQLINLIGELVITESSVRRELERQNSLATSSLASRLKEIIREVQELSLSLKLVPIGNSLQKMNRIVRDLAARLNRPCRLLIEGGDTEVDKRLLEGIADPLVHLIRNSLDHGIETTAEERINAGKPEVATIIVSAEHCGASILVKVEDDGRGLNRGRILDRAIERGIIRHDAILSPHEVDQLIFEPGFSTAETVSEVSGRGVGMDVVLRNIEAMRGSITVQSEPGAGTQVCIELPLTLSIIDGTVIRVGERSYVIPTLSVVEQAQTSGLDFTYSEVSTMLCFRDHFIPSHRLGELLGMENSAKRSNDQVCVVIESGQQQHALLVDEVVGQQTIVIKPIGGILDAFEIFAGGALLADGEIAFVLDLHSLCKHSTHRDSRRSRHECRK